MTTIAARLEQTKGHSSGFDYLRIGLSVSVIAWHTVIVCYGAGAEDRYWVGPLRPFLYFMLPSFFALSGFLVSASLFRNSVPSFLTFRALRIFPALFCEVVISALIIGPSLTTLSLRDYFLDPKLHAYFFNAVGRIRYHLPGLFLDNPFPESVNLQLWTVPYELECYVILTAMAIFGIMRSPRLFTAAFFMLVVMLSAYAWISPPIVDGGPPARLCVLSFLAGVLLYVWRDRVLFSGSLAASAVALLGALSTISGLEYLAAVPTAYLTVWLGLQDPRRLFGSADYSYGMYIYGFPIQQTIAHLLPQYRIWYVNLFLSLIATGFAAYLSWTIVESKMLKRKALVAATVERWLRTWLPSRITLLLFKDSSAAPVAS